MSSNGRDFPGQQGDGKRDSFNEYDWVAAAKSASLLSKGNDANNKAKKRESNSPSSAAGSALSEVSCDAISIMEWATDLLSPRERESNAQEEDVFTESPKEESPLRQRRIPSVPSRVRSIREGNYPAEQHNDPQGAQMMGVPNWEGITITADTRKADDVSVMTPFPGDAPRNYPKASQTNNKLAASEPNHFDNWNEFEVPRSDAYPDQSFSNPGQSSHFSVSEEGTNVVYKEQPKQQRKRRKLIWAGSIAVFLIVIIAVAVPLSKNSNNSSATRGSENISTGSKNTTTVSVESDSTPSQPAASPESEPAITEDESLVNGQATTVPAVSPESEPDITEDESLVHGQATTVPVESDSTPSQPAASPANEPISSPVSTVVESNPASSASNNEPVSSVSTVGEPKPSPPVPASNTQPVSPPVSTEVETGPTPSQPVPASNTQPVSPTVSTVVESNPAPSQPVPASNNEPVSSPVSTVAETGPTPSQPVPASNTQPVSPTVSTAVDSNPAPSQPVPASNNEPVSSPAVSTVVDSNPAPSQPVPASNTQPVSSPVSTAVDSNPAPSQPVPASNTQPVSPTVSSAVDSNPVPSQPVPASNNEPVSLPAVSTVVESNPAPSQPVPASNTQPVSSPVSTQVDSNPVPSQPAPTPNNEPVSSPAGSNVVELSIQDTPDASQSIAVPNPPPSPKPTQFPSLPPTPSCINVQITTDKFGEETSWVLRDVDRDTEIASVPEGTYGANEEASQDLCGLESGKYKFIIRDKYGDGMCCGNGRGKYRVFLNGQQIVVGGYFKKELSYDILIGYDPGTLTEREYQYWVGHNTRRKEYHEQYGKEYVPLAWSHSLAERARVWATALLNECDDVSIRHDPNRKGDGENLAKNHGSSNSIFGKIQPVEKIVSRWVEREVGWDWPDNAHLTQALWRGSSYVGCADAVEVKSDGTTCHVQVCRYRRAGNCNMGSSGGDWLTEMLKDETTCGEQCPEEGCYVTSFMTE